MDNKTTDVSGALGSLLARVDERTKGIQSSVENIRQDTKTYNEITNAKFDDQQEKIDQLNKGQNEIKSEVNKNLDAKFKDLRDDLEKYYVKKESFNPVQRIVFGLVGLVLTVVFTALLGFVVVK